MVLPGAGPAVMSASMRTGYKNTPMASVLVALLAVVVLSACDGQPDAPRAPGVQGEAEPSRDAGSASDVAPSFTERPAAPVRATTPPAPETKAQLLALAAMQQVGQTTKYDPAYVKLAYPGGDVPIDRGVCTDVVVRALRKLGVDLQVLIHEDMKAAFDSYPQNWGLKRPDRNIDHRRVPNIARYLHRKGKAVPVTRDAGDYRPGDIVVWRLADGRLHMGIVSNVLVPGTQRHEIVHNFGAGAQREDRLFELEVIDHFRYF